jgi:hypothetical protein
VKRLLIGTFEYLKGSRANMYRVIDPQPKASDISFWKWTKQGDQWGLIDPNNPDGEFIPLPEGVSFVSVDVVKRNNLWFWIRPPYANLSDPRGNVKETLDPLALFTSRQIRLVANCINQAQNDPAGMPAHNLIVLIDKLYMLLAFALNLLRDEQKVGLVERYKNTMGVPDYDKPNV